MRDGYLRGSLSLPATPRQVDVLAAYVAAGGSVADAAVLVGIRPSTAKRHLADLRAKSDLSTEQLIYVGRASGWLLVPSLEVRSPGAAIGPGARSRSDRRLVPEPIYLGRGPEARNPNRPSIGVSRRSRPR
jgi:hypothetical protein